MKTRQQIEERIAHVKDEILKLTEWHSKCFTRYQAELVMAWSVQPETAELDHVHMLLQSELRELHALQWVLEETVENQNEH